MNGKKHVRFDWAAKNILRDKKNFGILEGFLSELLKEDVKITGLLESESNQEAENDKFNRVDLYAENTKGEHFIIEVQNTRELDYLMRMLFATSKAVTEYLPASAKYAEIKKVIAVSIVYFDLGKGDDYIYVGQTKFIGLHTNKELQLSAAQKKILGRTTVHQAYPEYYLIRTTKFNNIIKDTLDEWIYFLKNSEILDNFKAKGMPEVREKLNLLNLPEKERRRYKYFLESLHDEASYAATIKIEREEAIEKARKETRAEVRAAMQEMMNAERERAKAAIEEERKRTETAIEEERKRTETAIEEERKRSETAIEEERKRSEAAAEKQKKNQQHEIALKLIATGMNNAEIATITGLPEKEVKQLRKKS
ncbi:MAG TPA: Rpn family recombination-promoting nuclease/putative transposase [Chitinophagales bacterium]|nr:Rpn family recombination-promoting nuclease/putative transposase [Chitinophagales bacterium]